VGTSKVCDWGEAGWAAFANSTTIQTNFRAAMAETRLLNELALQPDADFWPGA
jgi:hypothetical protein